MSTISREQMVEQCAAKLLSAIIAGSLKQCVDEIINDVQKWTIGESTGEDKQMVLLNEVKQPEEQTPTGVRPAEVGCKVSTGRDETQAATVGPGKKSQGWSDPFQGTSWGVNKK